MPTYLRTMATKLPNSALSCSQGLTTSRHALPFAAGSFYFASHSADSFKER